MSGFTIEVRKICRTCDFDKSVTASADGYISVRKLQETYLHMVKSLSRHEHETDIRSNITHTYSVSGKKQKVRKEEV